MSYKEFKAQMNVYLKNRQHALILLIDAGGMRSNDCVEDHWEKLKRLIALEAKQGESTNDWAMRAIVNTPSHYSCGEEVGATGILVRIDL